MDAKHTPGPWDYDAGDEASCGAIVAQNRFVCEFIVDQSTEDGRLIAAAPELLEALKEACQIIESEWPGTFKAGRAAIAKATGSAA